MSPKEMSLTQLVTEIKEIGSQLNKNENKDSYGMVYLRQLTKELSDRIN